MQSSKFAKRLIKTIENGNRIWFYGNGGSYSLSSHFVSDLASKNKLGGLLWPVSMLGANQTLSSGIANDNSFAQEVAIELRTYGRAGDLFVGISTSGESMNILNAIQEASRRGIHSCLLTSSVFKGTSDLNLDVYKIGNGMPYEIEMEFSIFLYKVQKFLYNLFFTKEMKKRALFIDRDGTIIPESIEGIQKNPKKILPGILPLLKYFKNKGFFLILISNQSSVGRGEVSIEKHWEIHRLFENHLESNGIFLNDYYYCLHDRNDGCTCRKPKSGSIFQAQIDWDLDLKSSFMIGNQESDLVAGKNAGCNSYLLRFNTDNNKWESNHSPTEVKSSISSILND